MNGTTISIIVGVFFALNLISILLIWFRLNTPFMDKLKELTQGIEFKVFNFWVKPKLQTYNAISKKKLYAYRIEPYNEKTEAHKLVKYLLKEI